MIQTVRDVMLPDPLTIDAKTSIGAAAALMRDYDVDRLPVVDHGRVVGMVSMDAVDHR